MILVWAGLRGGIAFALATSWGLPTEKQEQITLATSVLVIFTIFFYGLTTRPMI